MGFNWNIIFGLHYIIQWCLDIYFKLIQSVWQQREVRGDSIKWFYNSQRYYKIIL